MDFEPSEDQRLLVESVTRMLGDTYSFAQRKGYMALPGGYSPDMWSKFAELGLLGLPFAEEYGGFGGGPQEVMLVMQAFGRVLVLEPYLPTVVLCGTAINAAGTAAQKQELLTAIAEGSLKMAFAHGERQARYDLNDVVTTAKKNASGWVLDGSKTVVSHGEAADKIIVSARTSGDRHDEDGITLFIVDAKATGLARRGYQSRDDSRAADIALSNVSVPADAVLGEVGKGFPIIKKVVEAGIAATAAETVGAMEAMNEMTLEYSKTRVQFGNPIGSYQVVQHRMADMFMTQEQGRSMAMLATIALENEDEAERTRDIAMAKVGIGQAGRYVSQSAVQMHGGIGMTEEYAVGHYFRRCLVIERLWGDPAYYLNKLAEDVG
ncbi:acyl-CoA dehydrogenase family protein [Rhodopila sp.]|jgi:pimeloyl-CoA dehydrogenase small subunit|uniref:acyl-CoA dehydrogenase family protein n=1 Tax=Rhodopila sp. TaxID=2480087 RepID=UPI002CEC587E|nr:acyl-CoA dehydrogenase family protein [Rhodopila sp.]HVZ07225.1 acyl-CoA dehydrogenase family protein [Rhodopila sp.]